MLLDLSGCPKLVEGALCHSREDVYHGVDAVFLITVGKGKDLNAKCDEGAIEEPIQKESLAWKSNFKYFSLLYINSISLQLYILTTTRRIHANIGLYLHTFSLESDD